MHISLTPALDGGHWSNSRPGNITRGEGALATHRTGGLGWPQPICNFGEKKNFFPLSYFETHTFHPAVVFVTQTIQADVIFLLRKMKTTLKRGRNRVHKNSELNTVLVFAFSHCLVTLMCHIPLSCCTRMLENGIQSTQLHIDKKNCFVTQA